MKAPTVQKPTAAVTITVAILQHKNQAICQRVTNALKT